MNETIQSQQPMSRKERRELRRQEVRSGIDRAARGRSLRRMLTWVVVAAVLGGIVWLIWQAGKNAVHPTPGELAVPVSESDNILGNADAPITLVEYGDYQCPACGAFQPIVKQLYEDANGQIRLVFRHFPLSSLHPNAETAARAVQAAGLQGKYWEMHDTVFENQSEWAPLPAGAARAKLLEYAGGLGLDTARMDADMDSSAVKDKISADEDGGNAAGVNATPTFFVNGHMISDFTSLEDFQNKVLNSAAAATGTPVPDQHDDSGSMGEDL